MQLFALLPVLALIGSVAAVTEHPHAERLARQINPRRHHSRQVDRMVQAIKRRDALAAEQPRALAERPKGLRMKKRGSSCQANPASSSAASSAAAPAASASSDASNASVADNAVAPSAAASSAAAVQDNSQQGQSSAAAASAAPSATSSAAAAASSSASSSSSSSGVNSGSLTPLGKKAGLTAGDALSAMGTHIGWWYNWAPTEEGTSANGVDFVSMLWGNGHVDSTDASRLAEFEALTTTPQWIIGPEEPDCSTTGSADMSVADTATLWNAQMAPKGAAGSLLLSPSMCKQADENGWLKQFQGQISRDFDITNLHINKNSMDGVKTDLDYYWNTYGKPMWVSEFACVDDSNGFTPCTDQGEINSFINDIVALFESDSRVYAYAYSNGEGLGNVWPMWSNGALTQSGQTYLSAVSQYH
ncbi:hypothetical protein EHS25_007468 [Saitozyma podzolica]|uniref:Asl1-like glycosyl hydrolase catalytic domain-containing protein n=1 Tax=Saitozyma podzolica TaxID=1890683 RepID=A0A427YPW3_9TREE|nr:hypothetical protein EHS25_007468 [Saitozyma podzolica]